MFGAVVCPKCRMAVGADLDRKTVSCAHCGTKMDLTRRRVFFRTEDQRELVDGVRALTKRLADDPDVPTELKRPRTAKSRPVADKKKKKGLPIDVELSEDVLFQLMREQGVRDPEKELERLRASGRAVEVRYGVFIILEAVESQDR